MGKKKNKKIEQPKIITTEEDEDYIKVIYEEI
jgi:hypothetical protein